MTVRDEMMLLAFDLALEARDRGDHPFGAVLGLDGKVIETARNRVVTDADVTAHAELTLVRKLDRSGRLALLAEGVVYASCEPCPMCVGALFWAGARQVIYGLTHEKLNDLATPVGEGVFGFQIGAAEIGGRASPPMSIIGPEREDEASEAHIGFWPLST
ncbi:MAG: tRNA(Arg) A34 adenosine deaminase TadA [Candidatus Aldehydirespiratoraceae bacterium]|jgi:tRNA(Arg) A34 adenosine deaminase TadA